MLNNEDFYRYAVKRIPRHPPSNRDEDSIDYKFEAEKALLIDNPSVLPVINYFRDQFHTYVVYDHIDRGSMRKFLSNPSLPSGVDAKTFLWMIANDLLTGLKCLHDYKIVHGGIKPENIFFQSSTRVAIGDIGFVKLWNDETLYNSSHSDNLFALLLFSITLLIL